MFSIKTVASTVAAAGLVSFIGLAYAQTDPKIESPSNQGNTSMPSNSTSTQGNANMPNNSSSTQGPTTTPESSTRTQGSNMSSDNNLRADGSSDLEPRADRN